MVMPDIPNVFPLCKVNSCHGNVVVMLDTMTRFRNNVVYGFFILLTVFLNGLLACPSELCSCTGLGTVSCGKRRLERIPHFSKEVDKIYEVLELSRNEIYSVPPYAFQNILVKAIQLDRNPLIGLSPRAFDGTEGILEKLDLYSTDLDVVHWGVFRDLYILKELNLGRNGFFAIPKGLFDGLVSLQDLNFAWNKITFLQQGMFRGLYSLNKLNLMGNRITHIEHGSFSDLRYLGQLNLNSNQLNILDPLAFTGLDNLEKLYLENNHLSFIPHSAFVRLRSLKQVNLARNNLSDIHAGTFIGAIRLEEISLSDNKIANISTDAFLPLPRLKILNMEQNNLQTVGDNCKPGGIERVKEFYLDNNPIECTCRIAWIHNLVLLGTKVEGQCAGPDLFRGNRLADLNITSCEHFICH